MKYFITTAATFLFLATGYATPGTETVQTAGVTPERETVMPASYIESVGRMAYVWGWPLVNMHNRQKMFRQVPMQGFLGGVMPVAPVNYLTIFPDYGTPDQKDVAHPNQDVVYGFGIMDLKNTPVVIQVPDFGDRFWMYELADQRTDSYGKLGKMYATKPGFYLIVSPDWKGTKPENMTDVFVSPTDLSVVIPRIFMDDTKQDRIDIQSVINQISIYPLSEFDGTMKITKWKELPVLPEPAKTSGEKKWVNPNTFFETLSEVLAEVPPMKGEESLYKMFGDVLSAAANNAEYMKILVQTANAMEHQLIDSLFFFNNVGVQIDNYWTRPFNNAAFGFDYLTRTAIAKSNIFTNHYRESAYFYQYRDAEGKRLDASKEGYSITFAKNELPPVNGFWSITLYDENHFFHHNELKRYSLGTKNKSLKYNKDGSLTFYFQHTRPAKEFVSNWLPAPAGKFAVTIRAYWPQESIVNGQWKAPGVVRGVVK